MAYKIGYVYKLESDLGNEIYIGTTILKLNRRMDRHKSSYRRWTNGKIDHTQSHFLFNKYGIDNVRIVLLETVNYYYKSELKVRSQFYIKSLKCTNHNIPNRTQKEWYEDNKGYYKKYYQEKKNQHLKSNIKSTTSKNLLVCFN
jgi:hypothetical protein